MISEEKIKEWLEVINEVVIEPYWWINDESAYKISKKLRAARKAVPALIARVRELDASEKEAIRIITDLNGCCDIKDRQIERLEREADWLADKAQIGCHKCDNDPFPDCIKCMREKARKAVSNDRTRLRHK